MTPLIYAFHNSELGKTEQMALATLDGLREEFLPFVLAPEGEIIKQARGMGLIAQPVTGLSDFTTKLWLLFAAHDEMSFVATSAKFSYAALVLNFFYRRRMTHLFLVGDESEACELSKLKRLHKYDVTFVAQSKKMREKLVAAGARNEKIRVIEQFMPEKIKNAAPRRRQFNADGVKKIAVFSQTEAGQGFELLFDAIESMKALKSLEFKVYGTGSRFEIMKKRAAEAFPNVSFEGLSENIPQKLAESDLYLHLSPDASSNLTILGALAANVPVLVPETGDESFITDQVNGFCFAADDAGSLARRLMELSGSHFDFLNAVVKGGRCLLDIRFSAEGGIERFRRLINEHRAEDIHLTHGKLIL